jgi:ribosomal-protein-alanine N-acetyltransferase
MRKEDVTQVAAIDQEAFPSWWPLTNYEHELENRLAHYIVACDDVEKYNGAAVEDRGIAHLTTRIKELFNRGEEAESPAEPQNLITGFAGFWIMSGEAHIISIAVRTAYRGRGIGELILVKLIDLAQSLNAEVVTLEARVSNHVAQNLYVKYGFKNVGTRVGYYTDNREDAVIMTTDTIISLPYQSRFRKLKQDYTRRYGIELNGKVE